MKALFLANAPVTEQAKGLDLTAKIQEECRVVYEKDPEGEYDEKHIIMPVGSTYGG